MRHCKRQRRQEDDADNDTNTNTNTDTDTNDSINCKSKWWKDASDWIHSLSYIDGTTRSTNCDTADYGATTINTTTTTACARGFIHGALEVKGSHTDNDDGDNNRCIQVREDVKEGTVLMRIPNQALVTLKTVERCKCKYRGILHDASKSSTTTTTTTMARGKMLFEIVSRVSEDQLFHSKNDALLALYLAMVNVNEDVDFDVNGDVDDENENDGCPSCTGTKLYLATLPKGNTCTSTRTRTAKKHTNENGTGTNNTRKESIESYKYDKEPYSDLPRRWTSDKIDTLLRGCTSVIRHIQQQQIGIRRDYELYRQSCVEVQCQCGGMKMEKGKDMEAFNNFIFPPLEEFDRMLAAVGSRAFQGLGEDGVDAMIPLLDLMNHKRGIGGDGNGHNSTDGKGTGKMTSDVAYELVVQDDGDGDDEATATTPADGSNSASSTSPGYIRVMTKCDLTKGSIPGITYGAKGNAQLLVNYGFCLERNMEPDGSSNDVLEFEAKDGTVVPLRIGPKSYTYGCLIKLLEVFRGVITTKGKKDEHESEEQSNIDRDGKEDGDNPPDKDHDEMEDFLNACEEEDHGFDFYNEEAMMNDEDDGDDYDFCVNDDRAKEEQDASKISDCQALDALTSALLERMNGYDTGTDTLQVALTSAPTYSSDRFCAYLVQSELRIIDFYLHAAALIRNKLSGSTDTITNNEEVDLTIARTVILFDSDEDVKLRKEQAVELMNAFCQIRYPSI